MCKCVVFVLTLKIKFSVNIAVGKYLSLALLVGCKNFGISFLLYSNSTIESFTISNEYEWKWVCIWLHFAYLIVITIKTDRRQRSSALEATILYYISSFQYIQETRKYKTLRNLRHVNIGSDTDTLHNIYIVNLVWL